MKVSLESLVPHQADRDELLQLLSLLNTHWHQNEEAFASRSLAEWPQWCEDQGFRVSIIKDFVSNLDTLLYPDDQGRWLNQWLGPQNQTLTTDELMRLMAMERPLFLDNFEEMTSIAEANRHGLDSIAGGTSRGRRIGIDIGIFAAGAGVGVGLTKAVQKWKRAKAEADQKVERKEEMEKESLVERTEENWQELLVPGRAALLNAQNNPQMVKPVVEEYVNPEVEALKEKLNERLDILNTNLNREFVAYTTERGLTSDLESKLQDKVKEIYNKAKDQMQLRYNQKVQKLGKQDIGEIESQAESEVETDVVNRAASFEREVEEDIFDGVFQSAMDSLRDLTRL